MSFDLNLDYLPAWGVISTVGIFLNPNWLILFLEMGFLRLYKYWNLTAPLIVIAILALMVIYVLINVSLKNVNGDLWVKYNLILTLL